VPLLSCHNASRFAVILLLLISSLAAEEGKQESPEPKAEALPKASPAVDVWMVHARTYFRRHEYRIALLFLEGKTLGIDGSFIAGESLFRLGKYNEAKVHFENILKESKDPIERRKAFIRIFDITLNLNETQNAIDQYVAFGKQFKRPTARMRYGLGMALYHIGYFDRAVKVLQGIPKGSEFFIRARYILAALGLEKRKPQASAKLFNQIEKLKPVSVEDYTVHQMAILAQLRIYIDLNQSKLAEQTLSRISSAGEVFETATKEFIRAMLNRATMARWGVGPFKKASSFHRDTVETQALELASHAIERYRRSHEIDWRKPELLTLMTSLYVVARRYDEARLAYDELSDHYRPIEAALRSKENNEEVWYYFSLDFNRKGQPHRYSMIAGVPDSLIRDIPQRNEILRLRDEIEKNEKTLRELEASTRLLNISENKELVAARARQDGIVNAYEKMVVNKQRKIGEQVANIVNKSLAEADFKRAELVLTEMRDLKKWHATVSDFQSEKIELFEENVKKLDEGGSS
jgi:tetratricopeptide (TPR) repeat protein